jgi:nucleotide-binding universal stress UspA family protein
MSLPLDARLDEEETRAEDAIADAREIAEEHGVEVQARIVRARALSEAIVEDAERHGADLIVLGSAARWRRGSRLLSPTVNEVLRRAACEVMVVTYPEGVLEEDEGA